MYVYLKSIYPCKRNRKGIGDLSSYNKRNVPFFCFSFDHKEVASLRRYHTLCQPGFFVSRGRFLA